MVAEYVEEDFNRNKRSQATGFVGGYSETSWIHNLKREIERDTPFFEAVTSKLSPSDHDANSLTSVIYFLDDHELSMNETIDPYDRPPRDVADKLLHFYFYTVHPSFPIVAKRHFMQQYALFYSRPCLPRISKWLAILNLIFAIAAKYAHLIHVSWVGETNDPVVYFSRASKLRVTDNQLFEHPDLQQVQVEGLTAFYFLVMSQINRYDC
jgi:hypothetical protein